MLIKTEGIVIKAMDYDEGSKIITLLTKDKGKVSIVAKGAKKTKSRLNASTQVFCYGEYIYYLGNQSTMGTLNQADILLNFVDIYHDISKTSYSAYLIELVDKLTDQNDPNQYLFEQLLLSLININAGKDDEIITRIFEMKLFQIFGYRPHLQSCAICKKEDDLVAFSVSNGGLICNNHKSINPVILLEPNTIKLLRLFEKMDIKNLGTISVGHSTKTQLKLVAEAFYDEYIGIPLKSRNFLDQLIRFEKNN
ncbi:MAG: DNA repair protein RecO [Vulcanibacillus sp.]